MILSHSRNQRIQGSYSCQIPKISTLDQITVRPNLRTKTKKMSITHNFYTKALRVQHPARRALSMYLSRAAVKSMPHAPTQKHMCAALLKGALRKGQKHSTCRPRGALHTGTTSLYVLHTQPAHPNTNKYTIPQRKKGNLNSELCNAVDDSRFTFILL